MKVTRRKLASILAAGTVVSTKALAQTPTQQRREPATAAPTQSRSQALAQFKLLRTVEPATRFEA